MYTEITKLLFLLGPPIFPTSSQIPDPRCFYILFIYLLYLCNNILKLKYYYNTYPFHFLFPPTPMYLLTFSDILTVLTSLSFLMKALLHFSNFLIQIFSILLSPSLLLHIEYSDLKD